jgi:OmpA-OmpF porin, OOP family
MRLSKPLFWLLAIVWFAAAAWWYSSCSKCSTCSTASPGSVLNNNLPGFAVSDSNWSLSSSDNLRFGRSGSIPVLGTSITSTLDSISDYLKNHPDKTTTITGYYKADEKNNSSFENLGLARADEIKKWLIAKGVSEKNMFTQSQLEENLVFSPSDTLVGGISMVFNSTVIPVQEDLFQPRTVYFNTGQNTLPVDTAFTNYIQQVKDYLQNHSDKKLMVTGHTDNVGDAAMNLNLSANRAAFVKAELAKKGIAPEKIESIGKGPDEPIADNNTMEGKAKNRRVTIQLQ